MKTFFTCAMLISSVLGATAADASELELWRLDCGSIEVRDLSVFSDTGLYRGEKRLLTDSCYLIRHDDKYMLWDAGLPKALISAPPNTAGPFNPSLTVDIASQLAKINVKPESISLLGVSHKHADHLGQAADFPQAELLIGRPDYEDLKNGKSSMAVDATLLDHWTKGNGKTREVEGDLDVFGDGSVMMLAMPGHTAGEMALLVQLVEKGPVLLSGDVVHFEQQLGKATVPFFNANRAESLASVQRLTELATNLNATLVIQHEPEHVSRLPAFPASAR